MVTQRSRAWAFTCNNYKEHDLQCFRSLVGMEQLCVKYVVFGFEVAPTTGTPHLQGWIYLADKVSLKYMKQIHSSCNWSASTANQKSTAAPIAYCTKGLKYEEYGDSPVQGKRTDLTVISQHIRSGNYTLEQIRNKYPEHWFYHWRSFTAMYNSLKKNADIKRVLYDLEDGDQVTAVYDFYENQPTDTVFVVDSSYATDRDVREFLRQHKPEYLFIPDIDYRHSPYLNYLKSKCSYIIHNGEIRPKKEVDTALLSGTPKPNDADGN